MVDSRSTDRAGVSKIEIFRKGRTLRVSSVFTSSTRGMTK